jgi:hypothetical protein
MLCHIVRTAMSWGGGAQARAADGACPRAQPVIFTRVLAVIERSDEGEGDTSTPTPSPQAANTIEHPSRALLSHTIRIP